MSQNKEQQNSRLLPVLREGIAVIQMIFFKELKSVITRNHPDLPVSDQTMLTGAVVNEVFGTHNPEKKFQDFRNQHQGIIEQELLNISDTLPHMREALGDALRIQTLCDNQEGTDSTHVLKQADTFGILITDRELPLPSSFMETVRTLGSEHNLIIPPVEIDENEEKNFLR